MPTPVSTARHCLAAEAAAALDDAVAVARRRQHAQTTSLHVVFALLSSSSPSTSAAPAPSPLLRDALSRARSSAYSPRLQFKALELCFGVALDRLPSSSSAAASACADEPPVSNSLMAAIKRSQANQRRHPDTFHFYQQQQQQMSSSPSSSSASSSFSGIKVELQQLVLAILDDPVVSKVFGEAGFRSTDIKLAVLRPPPPILRFPRAARCPPLFLCNFSAGDEFEALNLTPRGFSFPFADGGDENCRRIGEIMVRKANRNPMLVGVGAGDAARDFARAVERQSWGVFPPELMNLKLVSLERELIEMKDTADSSWIKWRLEELGKLAREGAGLAVGIGDLKGLVESGDEVVNCLVTEMTTVLASCRERLWVMGWSATYETYMKFLSRYPTLDKDWDLQLQLIASAARPAMGGLVTRPPSLMESFVPFGGFFPTTYESSVSVMKPYSTVSRCQLCSDKYEQELATILKECAPSCENQSQAKLPSWLPTVDMGRMDSPLDTSKVKHDEKVVNKRVKDLQKKWNDHCQRFHLGLSKHEASKHLAPPQPVIGLPFVSDKDISTNPSVTSLSATQSQSGISTAFPVTVGIQTTHAATHGISLPLPLAPKSSSVASGLQVVLPEGLRTYQSAVSDLRTHGDRTSPSSVTSVTTDLVLGTCHEPSEELARGSRPKTSVVLRDHPSPSAPKSCFSSSNVSQKVGPSNPKAFYATFLEKVRRQEEAISVISQAIIQCKDGNERRRGASLKGDIWLSFLGPDKLGKKIAATALAELMFGSRESMISFDLGHQDGANSTNYICSHLVNSKHVDGGSRGKTVADHIAGEISKKPSCLVFLENVEKADFMVQDKLTQAVRTGKISDSHGREFGISNAVFVVTSDRVWDKGTSSPQRKKNCSFHEERILSAQKSRLKISAELISQSASRRPNVNVLITSMQESEKKQVASGKRKIDLSDYHKEQQQFSDSPKRPHKFPSAFFDLNLPLEEEVVEEADAECSSGSSRSYGEDAWVEEFLTSMDKNVNFEPFDFDSLADYVTREVSKRLCSVIGSDSLMEIDTRAMQQILAATWLLEDKRVLHGWLDDVLVRSFVELRRKCNNKVSARSVVKLVACEETYHEECAPGVLLPTSIILD